MADSEKHITFVDVVSSDKDEEDEIRPSRRATGSASLSTSTFSLLSSSNATAKCRRIFVNMAMFSNRIEPALLRKSPQMLAQLLSNDFEDFVLEKLGTRRLTFNLGPFALPDDADAFWDAQSSSTSYSSISGKSGDSILHYSDGDLEHVFLVSHGFSRSLEDLSDEHVCKSHVDISIGKGGMFTRTTYKAKLWKNVRYQDIVKTDLFIFCLCDTEVDESQATIEEPCLNVSWSASTGLNVIDNAPAQDGVCSHFVVLLEALSRSRNIIILREFSDISLPFLVSLESKLQSCPNVKIYTNFSDLMEHLENYETFEDDHLDLSHDLPILQVRTNQDVLDWLDIYVQFIQHLENAEN